ncbi:MAG: hypothetical protein ACOCUI_00385 [bacterium]
MKQEKLLKMLPNEVEITKDSEWGKKGHILKYDDNLNKFIYHNEKESSAEGFFRKEGKYIELSPNLVVQMLENGDLKEIEKEENEEQKERDMDLISFLENLENRLNNLEKNLEEKFYNSTTN